MDLLEITKQLINCPSVTPDEGGAIQLLHKVLENIGFKCERMEFEEVDNLYARFGTTGKNFCFAGHTDVVPPGDVSQWKFPPFEATIENGYLYGRGAVDMKPAITAFIVAACEFTKTKFDGSISLLITADEEGPGINGTKRVLEALAARGEKIDACIVGEPTNPNKLGEMAKIGRRGSMNAHITVTGIQGHAAYPHNARNPVTRIIDILHTLKHHKLDDGNEFFSPSNLEVVTVDVGNKASNVIPAEASATFNIRFNDQHSSEKLKKWVLSVASGDDVEVKFHVSGESFLTKPGKLAKVIQDSAKEVTGITPELSTTGGTSDARFIANYAEVAEFGLINTTAHRVNECVLVSELEGLKEIYLKVLQKYFA